MKKMIGLIGLMAILFLCLSSGQAWADSAKAKASAESNVGIYQDDHTQVETFEKRQFPLATGPTTFVGTPFTQLQKGKWFIFWTELDKEFTVENIDMMRKRVRVEELLLFKWLKRHVRTARREKPLSENADPIRLLNWDPEKICHPGDKEIAEVSLKGDYSWKPWPFISVLGVALNEAKKESHTRRVVVYVRFSEKAVADGLAIGTGGAGAKMMGPAGEKVDNIAGVLTAGAMIGTTELSMEDIEEIRIRCLNDGPVDAPVLPKKEEPKPEAKIFPSPSAKQEVEVKIKIETPSPVVASAPVLALEPKKEAAIPSFVVYFDFDKSDVKREYLPKIVEMAKWLREQPSFKVQIEGHACHIGSFNYNAALARKRAEAVYDLMKDLVDDRTKRRIVTQFVSLSEDFPASETLPENRRVIVRMVGPASGK